METENSEDRLADTLAETARLRSENGRLRKLLRVREACPQIVSGSEMEAFRPEFSSLTADEKIRLFRSLFRGREGDGKTCMPCGGREGTAKPDTLPPV
jgi:hypothetical protein